MAFTMTELAATIWRDYNTVGVPASGKYSPEKSEIRQWGLEIEQYLNGTSTLDQVKIGGGSINSTPIGPTSRSTGAFTTLAANAAASLLGGGTLTGTFAGNPILSGNPAFTGQPDFASATNKAAIRVALGLAIGTDVLAFYSKLDSLGGLTGAADRVPYMTGANTFALATLSTFIRTLLDDPDAPTARGTIGALAKAGDTLTGGFTTTAVDDGTKSSGTYEPTPTGGNFKRIVNDGAFTLAAPTASGDYQIIIQVTNGSTPGVVATSGFSRFRGTISTTASEDFMIAITKINGFVLGIVEPLQ